MSKDGSFEMKMNIYNALEITVKSDEGNRDLDDDEMDQVKFTYDLVDYKDDSLWL